MNMNASAIRLVAWCVSASMIACAPATRPPSPAIGQFMFSVNQPVVIEVDGTYYLGKVTRVAWEDPCTRVDYAWTWRNTSGSGYSYPDCGKPSMFTIAEAQRRRLSIADTSRAMAVTSQPVRRSAAGSGARFAVAELLDAHNAHRKDVGVPPLVWSDALAKDAQAWADHLASVGGTQLAHAPQHDEGENLWLGTSSYFSFMQMVNGWGSEKQYFKDGRFPDVSATGNWTDVGHYTQMVWKSTTMVGCASATAGGNDLLVCRYSPHGNVSGRLPLR